MTPLFVALALATTPPLMPVDAPPPMPPPSVLPLPAPALQPVQPVKPPVVETPPPRLGVYFQPMSVFALALFVEADLAIAGGFDVFACAGGGPLGQFAFEAGLRYYALGKSMEGFFIDVHAGGFALPSSEFFMLSPGMVLGHAWRRGAFLISVGAGFATWSIVNRGVMPLFFGSAPAPGDVFIFPGLSMPNPNIPAVQPTIRLSIGFGI